MTVAMLDTRLLGVGAELELAKRSFADVGFVGALNAETVLCGSDLKDEAVGLMPQIKRAQRDDDSLRYSAGITALGPKAQAFLQTGALSDCLFFLTGTRFALTEDMSCLTVYEAGDQLGIHLDQPPERCAVTCIFYLSCSSPDPTAEDTGLQLRIYGTDASSTKVPPRAIINTKPGRLVFGRGSQVWHERPKLKTGEAVMALTACFGVA